MFCSKLVMHITKYYKNKSGQLMRLSLKSIFFILYVFLHVQSSFAMFQLASYLLSSNQTNSKTTTEQVEEKKLPDTQPRTPASANCGTRRVEIEQALNSLPSQSTGPIYINLNVQDNTSQQNQNIAVSSSKFFNQENYHKIFSASKEHAANCYTSFVDWLKNNKIKFGLYCAAAGYSSLQGYLFYLKCKLASPNCWSKWQWEKPIEQMYQTPQAEFAHNLLIDIQRHYTTINNPTDFVTPLTKFMKDTEQEYNYLYKYKKIITYLEKLYISKVFFYDANLLASIDNRLQKLSYIKNTFLSWLADYKLNYSQNNQSQNSYISPR